MFDCAALITRLYHIGQQVSQSTTQFQDIVSGDACEHQALPDTPLTCKWNRAGKAIQVAVVIECLKHPFAKTRSHCSPAFVKMSSSSLKCSMIRSGLISPRMNGASLPS